MTARFSPELRRRLADVLGQEEALELMERVPAVTWSELATKADLERFATKVDLERFATKVDLERFATKVDLERFATKADLERFATKADLERFVTKDELRYAIEATEARLRGEILELRAEMSDRLQALSLRMTTTMVSTMLGGIFGAAGMAFAAARVA